MLGAADWPPSQGVNQNLAMGPNIFLQQSMYEMCVVMNDTYKLITVVVIIKSVVHVQCLMRFHSTQRFELGSSSDWQPNCPLIEEWKFKFKEVYFPPHYKNLSP